MATEKEVTIYDIAKELDLSPATVSRALNGNELVKEKTRKKIADVAEKLGYRVNSFAKDIRTGKTKTLGVIVHELNSKFVTSVISGIEKVASLSGYDIIIGHSMESKFKERQNVANLFNKRVDGLLASLAFDTDNWNHYQPLINKNVPIVFYDRVFLDGPFTKITLDNFKAGYEATEHLIVQGCRRIMHVTADTSKNVYRDRLEGYKAALKKYGLPIEDDLIRVTRLNEESGVEEGTNILSMKNRPDGVFVANDFCAVVIMNQLIESGVRIPEDVAFVGFNNEAICNIIRPKLSSIIYSGQQMGEIAAKRLIDKLNGLIESEEEQHVVMQPTLVIRGSSMKKRH
ncbi:MAG: LacI family transcriptional regulator [Pseudopedobacter saltans]|uniref:LacI family transcriptional regulator n=1 Tax=Pseudopedobacter saltans TaxID=151895 RepID=A0A2W5EZ70_9SPHI|nr:MAG: LacI family transcriptional regulator [Pseudopedobacter saltans]